MATLDPWVVREAKAVVTKVLDGPTPPPAYAALSEGQKSDYRQKFLNALYTDAGLNQFCQDKRVAYYTSLVADCRPLMSRLPAKTSAQGRANANYLLNVDPSSLPSSELRKELKRLRQLKSYLDDLPAKKPTKVEEEVEEEIDAGLTEMARAVLRESKLTDLDYAKKIGRRILHYEAAIKEGTPASHSTAGNLWRELRNSLAGWLAATDGAVKSIEAYQGETSDRYLSAFAKKGYAPVSNGKTHVHAQWTQSIPKPLVEWQSEWPLYIPKNDGNDPITGAPGGSYTPAEVAQWLYEANLGRTYLSTFLGNYDEDVRPDVARSILEPYPVPTGTDAPPPLFALDSSEALGNGTAPDKGKVGATPLTPSFDLLVRGSTYFTGPLTQRATRLRVDLEAYVNQQTALKEAGKEQDPLGSIKFPALQSALNFLQKKTENESDSWSEISQKTSARDPWIPLNILSAFASWKCQFPHSEWGEFFTHPSGVTPGEADWWRSVSTGYDVTAYTRYEARRAIQRGARLNASAYDPFAGERSVFAQQNWPNPQTLKVGRAPVKPYRLEVVQLGPKGAYAYRTFDWFQHKVEANENFEDIVRLYKLPSESEEEFTAAVKEENGVSDVSGGSINNPQLLAWIDGGASPPNYFGLIAVPRVIPLLLLKKDGSAASSGGIAGPKSWRTTEPVILGDFKAAPGSRTLGSDTVLKNYTREDIRRLNQGISPIARLFIFYLNNDYSPFSLQKGLSDLFYKPATLYRALTGDDWPDSAGASSPKHTNDQNKPEYLGPGNFKKAMSRYRDWVNAYRTLYIKAWSGAQYVNVEKEVAANEEEQRKASAPDYAGTVNPALIPLEGTVKERVFVKGSYYGDEPQPHRIGQGFLSRITRRRSGGGSQLSSIERAMGIPETDITLTNLGKEVKRSVQQLRITQFENLVSKAFLAWMDEEGPMGPKRLQYQKSLTAAYNRAWSGYFTPNRVEDGKAVLTAKKGAAFAPANKYNVRALYGPRLDLSTINPATNKPYSTAVSDKIARWNPRAIARKGTEKSLYPYQSDAVLRLVDKNGGLLAFDVGVGKTITSLAAVGMLKQQGKATRPVFLVPKSIKLKWWKDMKENYPDWRVGVFGMKIGYPQKESDLDATSKAAYKRYKSKLAGEDADDETLDNADKAAMLIVTGQASVREAIIKVWGKLPGAVKKRVENDLNAKNPPMVPSWKQEDDSDKLLKLQKFRDGYYDCLLLDEYDFKQIGISREKASAHLLQSSPTFGYIFAKAFGSVTGFLGKPTRLQVDRLTLAFEYLGLPEAMYRSPKEVSAPRTTQDNKARNWRPARSEGPFKDPTNFQNRQMTIVEYAQEDFLLETNGTLSLWPWCPVIAGDTFPFYDSVRAYIASELPNIAGAKPGLFESLSDLFFERNLTRPRSAQDDEAFDYYVEILNADKDIQGKPSGAYIVGTAKGEGSADAVRRALRHPDSQSLSDAIKNYMGSQASYPSYQNFYSNIERSGTPARYPDGTFIPNAQALNVINYNFSTPQGRQYFPLIQEGVNGWEFVEPTITQTATDVAQLVADVINVDPSAYGLTGPVKVVEEFASDYPSPFSTRNLLTPPSRMAVAKRFTRLIKPYLGQTSAFEDPEITWEDLKVDSFIIDEAHKFKGLFEPGTRGGKVEYLTSGSASTQGWLMEYMTHTVKKRGGQVMLLTATPAKQSPVDFYNIVQLIGGRDLGPHENLYNLFNINTPEQFISRFVCVQERVIVNSNYEARRGIAATMFGPFGNLLTEFTQIFKRYSDRKTVADAPYLRGTTAATTRWNDYSPAQQSQQGGRKNAVLWANGTWDAEGDVVTTIGPSMEEVFKGGLPRARLRVWRGDDTGDFRILGWASTPRGDGTFENRVTVTPTFGSPAGSKGYDAQPWTIFKNTKVPVPVITKPVIRMGEIQKDLYESYQRALGLMMVEGTNSVRVEIDGAIEVVERRVIFATLSRLALHPELQAYSARFALDTLDEDPEEEEEEAESSEEDEALKEAKITAARGQIFTDSIVGSYREGIDPNPWTKGTQGETLRSLQCFTGINEKKGLGHGGRLGWNGKAEKLNPQYLDLRDMYAEKSAEEGEARAAGTEEEWGAEDSGMGVGGDLTNDELLRRLRTALDATLKNPERQAALSGTGKEWAKGVKVLNPSTQAAFPTKGKDNPVQNQKIKIPAKDGPDDPEVFKLNANASRTLGIADTIVAQKLRDTINPWMGSVTCGTIVFVNNLLYQGMQVMTICRLYAIAQAALYELKAYKKSLKGAVPSDAELKKILRWHGLGVNTESQASWECPYTTRALLTLTWPEANIENLDEHNTYAGDPDKSPSPLCKVIRKVQNSVHEKAFGMGTYSTPTVEGDGPVFQGSRYSFATVGDPELWVWLSEGASKGSEPTRWASYGVSGASLKSLYADAWVDMATKCCLMNAPMAPGAFREELAQKFNGEYIEVQNSQGQAVTKCIREPDYDVVIANQVAYEGIDLQKRTCRIINGDLPFTPADLVQRNGRAIRNGNLYEKAEIQAVLALDTVDYYRIQAIERKRGWLDSALDEGKASYELTNDEVELLDLATKAVLPDQREAVRDSVAARLEAIASESRERSLAPILNQLTIAATKQRTININSAADEEVYSGSIETNKKAKTAALRQSARPTGGCG